jgi:predicted nuclease of predicted toxin-antitoxin system
MLGRFMRTDEGEKLLTFALPKGHWRCFRTRHGRLPSTDGMRTQDEGILPQPGGHLKSNFFLPRCTSLRRLPDPEVLALAAQEGRILVTHDRRTMPRHFVDFILHHSSPGVFIIAQTVSVRVAIEELLLVWAASESAERRNLIVELPL